MQKNQSKKNSTPEIREWEGRKLLVLNPDIPKPYKPFSFSYGKAEAIIENYNQIATFARTADIKDDDIIGIDEEELRDMKIITDKYQKNRIDITPQDHTGKPYQFTPHQAKLIVEHKEVIRDFLNTKPAYSRAYTH